MQKKDIPHLYLDNAVYPCRILDSLLFLLAPLSTLEGQVLSSLCVL